MKYVFVIHSNTVLLSALGAIEYEHFMFEDCIFLYGRHFKSSIVPDSIETHDISDIYFDTLKWYEIHTKKYSYYQKRMDDFFDSIIKDEFEVFLPHMGMMIYQTMMTNPSCRGCNILQEGAFSHFGKLDRPWRVWLYNKLFSTNRRWYHLSWQLPSNAHGLFKPHKTYSLNADFFKPFTTFENIVIKWPQIEDESFIYPVDTNVFLFESAVELGFVEKGIYLKACKILISQCDSNNCMVKFHPNQSPDNIKDILKLFEGKTVTECRADIPFELVMACSKKLKLYGFSTSLLTFGQDLGHSVLRLENYLINNSKKYRKYYASKK